MDVSYSDIQSNIVQSMRTVEMVVPKKNNRLIHSENQMDEGNHAVNVSAVTENQNNYVTSFFQIAVISIQSGRDRLKTYVFLDNGSTVLFIDRSCQKKF